MSLRTYIVTYDITDDRRRRRVFKALHGFGDHLQYSVFRCDLSLANKVRMKTALAEILHHRDDQVLIFDLGPVESIRPETVEYLGVVYKPAEHEALVI